MLKTLGENALEYIRNGHYTLILDESIDLFQDSGLRSDDFELLKIAGAINEDFSISENFEEKHQF